MSNQAQWIPEAGGYVLNGQVISTTPVYDANNSFQLQIDSSKATSKPTSNPEVSNVGVGTQGNRKNSGQDVNSVVTQANSMNALSENTANTNWGAINTPATQSNVAGQPTFSEEDEHWRKYQEYVATNNLQGQINELTAIGQINGVDYSSQINNLTAQRIDKIQNQDNSYQMMYDQAMAAGDYDRAFQISQDRDLYRQKVNYDDAMMQVRQQQQIQQQQQQPQQIQQIPQPQAPNYMEQLQSYYQAQLDAIERSYQTQVQEYEVKKQEINLDYNFSYMSGVHDITNSLMQLTGSLLNFQYDPNQDRALQVAQGYAVGAVKEQMNHTGMYYSSMTQNAITRAVAELVPVYEKMAKEEIRENVNLLQNTANFLMNLETTQYNLWKNQIELQWEANAERRKEYQAALDRANAWGYVSNADAAILGVAPGTLSPEAIKSAKALEQQLLKEQRDLQAKMIMEGYTNDLAIQKMYLDAELDDALAANKAIRDYNYTTLVNEQEAQLKDRLTANQQYRDFQYDTQARQQQAEINDMLDANKQARDYGYSSALAEQKFGYDTALKQQDYRNNSALKAQQYNYDANLARIRNSGNSSSGSKTRGVTTDSKGNEVYQYGNLVIQDKELGEKFADIMDKGDVSVKDLSGIFTDLKNASAADKQNISDYVLNNVVYPNIDTNSQGFKKNDDTATRAAVNASETEIQDFAKYLKNAGLTESTQIDLVENAYGRLLTNVDSAGDDFDWSYFNLDDLPEALRETAKQDIIKGVANSVVKSNLQSKYPAGEIPKSELGKFIDEVAPKDFGEAVQRVVLGANPTTAIAQGVVLGSKAIKALQK